MNKHFFTGLVVGAAIVLVGLFIFGDKIFAPEPTEEDIRALEQRTASSTQSATTSDKSTIWNEFDGEIGI